MKAKQILVTLCFFGTLLALSLCLFLMPPKAISESERRPLLQFQTYKAKKAEAEKQGQAFGPSDYFSFLETVMQDQFPARDGFRSVKATVKRYALGQRDNNGYYLAEGSLCRMTAENEKARLDNLGRLDGIYKQYFAGIGAKAYYAVIPSKEFYLAERNGYPHPDYESMEKSYREGFSESVTEIGLRDVLSAESYFITDPHFRQNTLLPLADRLLSAMGRKGKASDISFTEKTLFPFYGTYYGQAALPVGGEVLSYLDSDALSEITVKNLASGEEIPVYSEESFQNPDPYDVFLGGGTVPLLRIQNPNATEKKQLVVFRDSFAANVLPLLISEYSEIIAVDIRYVSPKALPKFVRFTGGCDVLFLYSDTVLESYGAFLD